MTKGDDRSRLAIDCGGQQPVTDVHSHLHFGLLGHAIPPESPILIGRVVRGRSLDMNASVHLTAAELHSRNAIETSLVKIVDDVTVL
jgi:hypothetical protein